MPDDGWSDRRDALPQGCVLRDYTIQAVLGHGGFGIVYKASHNELNQVVAIKEYLPSELAVREGATVRAKSADCETYFADGLRRFREEANALAMFQQHPSIIDCRELFRANGTAYLVMEYVEGRPLSELLRQREAAGQPFTESDLLGIAIPLAQGLAHIHRAGVIHRDITPANILVRKEDQRPVLIDFGAARQAVAQHSRSLAPYTESYAALEQVAGGPLGPWTDLYGFGAVLWRIVAGGNRPWEPPDPVRAESRANARMREADDPLPTAKELGAGRFAEGLLEMIDGCLQLRDTERLGDTEHVVGLLRARGGGDQVLTGADSRVDDSTDAVQSESVSEDATLFDTLVFLATAALFAAGLALPGTLPELAPRVATMIYCVEYGLLFYLVRYVLDVWPSKIGNRLGKRSRIRKLATVVGDSVFGGGLPMGHLVNVLMAIFSLTLAATLVGGLSWAAASVWGQQWHWSTFPVFSHGILAVVAIAVGLFRTTLAALIRGTRRSDSAFRNVMIYRAMRM